MIGRFAIGTWYLYALVTTASYAGEIRSPQRLKTTHPST